MSTLKGIPVVTDVPVGAAGAAGGESVRSGQKYLTPQGFTAIKDGLKSNSGPDRRGLAGKPRWLKAPIAVGDGYDFVRRTVREHRLATVCEEAKCPNIGECWNAGTATIMLMGAVCTRACRFCAVDTGNPRGWLDADEPHNVAASVALMKLKYVVLTSVNRDDLPDGGARHYATCVRAIKERNPGTAVEALTPDFQGVLADVECVIDSGLDVFAQNVETVRRLTHPVRDPRAAYEQTLAVLAHAKRHRPQLLTKTSLMLGLGESELEIAECMQDLRAIGVDILTLGQYLRPTANHLSVERFVTPEEFERYRSWGLARGFRECVSGPLVRSSYRAEQALAGNNVGLTPLPATDLSVMSGSHGAIGTQRALPLPPTVGASLDPAAPAHDELSGVAGVPHLKWLGRVDYLPTWRAMQRFTDERDAQTADEVWLLEHESVFTLGMNADRAHVLEPGDIPVLQIDRGGQVTYHGPGQLVVYPMIDVRRGRWSVRELVSALESSVIEYAAQFGIEARCRQKAPGVYVDGCKLASIGLRIRRGGSYHGVALNVNMDLEPFQRINPCGYAGLRMTQLAALGGPADVQQVAAGLAPVLISRLTPR